jgi:pimeloyl-ACP methyl ester carboxylesterase
MLHGFGASLHSWDAWATVLSDRYRVIRYDLPGAGLTGADPGGDYSDARGAVILVGLLDHFRIPHATLVGHSMGGRLAWRFAAEHDARVDKLVLIAPDGFAIADGEYGKTPEVSAVLKLLPYVFPRLAARQSLQPAYANPDLLSDELLTRYYELILAPGVRKAMIAKLEQSVLSDPVPLLKRIAAPTLLIWGDQDAMIPITNAKDYLKALPAATLITIAGSGHLPHEEASEKSLVAVKEFLDK